MNTLYYVAIGKAIYWSTSITEINSFANLFGLSGQVEERKGSVKFEIPGIVCVHQF